MTLVAGFIARRDAQQVLDPGDRMVLPSAKQVKKCLKIGPSQAAVGVPIAVASTPALIAVDKVAAVNQDRAICCDAGHRE
jgi:hypothetical protein